MDQKTDISTLSLAILGLITQRPQTGYDIRKAFSSTPLGHFSSSPGAIYPALKRLEKAGWIAGSTDHQNTLRPRKVYTMTRGGTEALCRYLRLSVTPDDVIWRMDDLMLRFAFMEEIVGREATRQFLHELASELEAHVRELQRYLDGAKVSMSTCGRLAMENGIEGYQMNAAWARRAIEELRIDT